MITNFSIDDHNYNLKYNLAHEFFWGFGVAFHTIYAVVPLFLKELGAPDYIVVSTAGLFSIAIAFPTLLIAALGRNIINIKRAVIVVHGMIVFISFLMGFTFTFINTTSTAWEIYFIYFILYAFSIGVVVPIWAEFLNQSTLRSHRGKFFGLGFAFNSFGSFIGGLALRYILDSNLPFPKNFGVGFIILFFCLMIGTILFIPFRIKQKTNSQSFKSLKQFLTETKLIVFHHKNFQRYILSRVFYSACLPGMGLYAIYCQNKFNFAISEAGTFTIITVIFSGLSSYIAGHLGDLYGHKTSMLLAYSGHLIAVVLAIYASNMLWVYGIFIAIGIGQGAFMPSAMNLIYDFSNGENAKTYMALIDSLLAPFILIFIIFIGWLIENEIYTFALNVLFGSLVIGISLLLFKVKDPKKHGKSLVHIDGFSS